MVKIFPHRVSPDEKKEIFLKVLETVLSFISSAMAMFEAINENLMEKTGKKSFAIDHLIFALSLERDRVRDEMNILAKKR